MSITICIPARLDSKRLPGKLLMSVSGEPLIRHVVRAATSSQLVNKVIVAADSSQLAGYVSDLCGVVIIDDLCWCGTQRTAIAAHRYPYLFGEIVISLQADEPLIQGCSLDSLILRTQEVPIGNVATLVAPLDKENVNNQHVTKAAVAIGRCHWFSRAPIAGGMHHIGAYGFHRITLEILGALHQTPLSKAERLEQLTWLENDRKIYAAQIDKAPLAINTQEDYDRFANEWS